MRLASITLPYDLGGEVANMIRLDRGHEAIRDQLTVTYGGYTRLTARGMWLSPELTKCYEPVYRYEFACEDNEQEQSDLRALAFRVKVLTDEQSIMVVHANGEVEFI